jgi:amino acid transporter
VLPAAAVDRPIDLGKSWRRLGGNTWRYIGALILVVIPAIIVGLILMALFLPFLIANLPSGGQVPSVTFIVIWNLVSLIFTFFATAVGITVLSKFYRHIVGGERGEGGVVTVNRA